MAAALASSASADFPSFSYSSSFGSSGTGNGQFQKPIGIATDSKGNVWVADSGNGRIQVFDSSGKYVRQFSKGKFPLVEPTDVALDAKGDAWVVDSKGPRIVKFDSEGKFLSEFGESGTGNGQLSLPNSIAVDSKGNLWVSDAGNKRIQEFNSEGKYIRQAGKEGTGDGQFTLPQGIAVASDDSVWVADKQIKGGRIEKFTSEGSYAAQMAKGLLSEPSGDGLAIDAAGNIWIADTQANVVRIYSVAGVQLTQFGGAVSLPKPHGIAFDPNGNPWITAVESSAVQKWLAAPEVTTETASEVKPTTAKLKASVNPRGSLTTYQFEYGTTASYGTKVPVSPKSIGSGNESEPVSELISGLTPEVTYHYRIVATSAAGVSQGKDKTLSAGEETGEWLLGKAKVATPLLPLLKMALEGGSETMSSKILGVKIEKQCTAAELTGAKLEEEGRISSSAKIKFSGCQIKLNGTLSKACEPYTGVEKGVILTNALKGQLVFHEGEGTVRLRPASGTLFMTIQLKEECALGEEIPVGGILDLKDKAVGTEATEHLVAEGTLKGIWFISNTAEHKVTTTGSAILTLTGEHSGLQWSGRPA